MYECKTQLYNKYSRMRDYKEFDKERGAALNIIMCRDETEAWTQPWIHWTNEVRTRLPPCTYLSQKDPSRRSSLVTYTHLQDVSTIYHTHHDIWASQQTPGKKKKS